MWRNVSIGPKILLMLGAVALALSGTGVWLLYGQEQEKMFRQLEEQGSIIQAQIEVTRAYIAKNYVGKVKNSPHGQGITVARDHEGNPDAIPFPATATREIGEMLGEKGIFQSRLISDKPLNPKNLPRDAFERQALQAILAGAPSYSQVEQTEHGHVFRRASADKASVQACVGCHTGRAVGDLLGMLSVSIPMEHMREAMIGSLMQTGTLLVSIILASLGCVYLLVHKFVVSPLHHLTRMAKDIASGEGDLTKRVPVVSEDELGKLGQYFNQFIDKLQRSIRRVGEVTNMIASASVELSATADEMARGAEAQTSRMTQAASAVEEMSMTAGEVARSSQQAASIAQETAQTAQHGHEVVMTTVAGMNHVSDAVGQSARIISALGQSSDQIGEIVRVIEEIADQTNLLALNAAIEAARAGEQGRGFAVVADEVRKLAERTTKATKEIGDMIRQIQNDTKSAVASMEEGTAKVITGVESANKTGEALTRIQEMVQQTAAMIKQIAEASEEQSVATKQIASDLEAVTRVSRDSSVGSSESAKASHDLSRLSTDLQSIVKEFRV